MLAKTLLVQHLLPRYILTWLVGKLARCNVEWLKNFLIRCYCRYYTIDLAEARQHDYRSYRNFNDFFTRAPKEGARPRVTEEYAIAAPVDGTIYQLGSTGDETAIGAKGGQFSLVQLLGEPDSVSRFGKNGNFLVLYLSPADYHRIYMPYDGRLVSMRHIPGTLFSVNPRLIRKVPGVFASNERLVVNFSCNFGPLVMVLVGALVVGSIEVVWEKELVPHEKRIKEWVYEDENRFFVRGMEVGRFNLGSTVIVLLPASVQLNGKLQVGQHIKMHSSLGRVISPS